MTDLLKIFSDQRHLTTNHLKLDSLLRVDSNIKRMFNFFHFSNEFIYFDQFSRRVSSSKFSLS